MTKLIFAIALLTATPALAQDQPGLKGVEAVTAPAPTSTTYTGSVLVGDTAYHVDTWVSPDGKRIETTVTAAPVFSLYNFFGELRKEKLRIKALKAEEKRLKAEQQSAIDAARVFSKTKK